MAGGVVSKDSLVVNALCELSVRLCRVKWVLYKRSLYALARLSGNAFRAGAGNPTSGLNLAYFLSLHIDCSSTSVYRTNSEHSNDDPTKERCSIVSSVVVVADISVK